MGRNHWVDAYRKLRASMNGDFWWTTDVPHGENLTPGPYELIVTAHDGPDGTWYQPHHCTENKIRVTFKADD